MTDENKDGSLEMTDLLILVLTRNSTLAVNKEGAVVTPF